VNPNIVSTQPYQYIKGGAVYAGFYGLPEFSQYARLDGAQIVSYPPTASSVYLVGEPNIIYTYHTRIIDYITDNTSAVADYMSYLPTLGFINCSELKSEVWSDYADFVYWNLKYDTSFQLEKNGVFTIEDEDSFRWLLIGKSVTYDSKGKLVPCVEFRLYALTNTLSSDANILADAGNFGNIQYLTPTASGLTTPNAAGDIQNIQNPSPPASYTPPSAVSDIHNVPNSLSGLSTPNALNDILNIPNPPASDMSTPNAAGDIQNAPNTPASGMSTPSAANDILTVPDWPQ